MQNINNKKEGMIKYFYKIDNQFLIKMDVTFLSGIEGAQGGSRSCDLVFS